MNKVRIVMISLVIIVTAICIVALIKNSKQTKDTYEAGVNEETINNSEDNANGEDILLSSTEKEAINYLEEHALSPEDYILDKFKNHDVIFLGEIHRVKSQVEFISDIIPKLQDNDIHILVMEFAREIDQPLIDELLSKKEWDEKLARQIIFNWAVYWGYQEYVDIFKAAWQLNQSLDQNEHKFRILGMNSVTDWSVLQKPEDEENPTLRTKVWGGVEDFEAEWADVIMDEVINQSNKALVYCGIHHAFTAYKQPIYDFNNGKFIRYLNNRVGNYVYNDIGKRCITVSFYSPWSSSESENKMVLPVDGSIDRIMNKLSDSFTAAGFDTDGTPFGDLTSTTSIYKYGYDNFTLKDFCDGILYLEPLKDSKGVTPIKDFVNEDNLTTARQQIPNTYFRKASLKEFNEAIIQDANVIDHFLKDLY